MSRTDVPASTDWAGQNLGTRCLVLDEDVTAYGTGHIPDALDMP